MKRLSEKEWSTKTIGDAFSVSGTTTTHPSKLAANGSTPRITCASVNNGLDNCYRNEPTEQGGVLTVDSATVGTVLFQPSDFIATDHVEKISGDKAFSEAEGLFIKTCIDVSAAEKYQYGYKFSQNRIKRQKLMLPVDDKGNPDYAYMKLYSTEVRGGMLMRYKSFIAGQLSQLEHKDIPDLGEKEWGEFLLGDIFTVDAGKRLETRNKIEGNRPFIGATDNGNGVTGFVGNDNTSKDSNVLGVNYNGAPCIAFYHPYECIFTDDVKRLHLKNQEDNKFVLLFFTSIFAMQRVKYSYGYKFKEKRMHRQKLMLPITDTGKPDYKYMEQYAKNMMLKKYEQYLAFINRQTVTGEV